MEVDLWSGLPSGGRSDGVRQGRRHDDGFFWLVGESVPICWMQKRALSCYQVSTEHN